MAAPPVWHGPRYEDPIARTGDTIIRRAASQLGPGHPQLASGRADAPSAPLGHHTTCREVPVVGLAPLSVTPLWGALVEIPA